MDKYQDVGTFNFFIDDVATIREKTQDMVKRMVKYLVATEYAELEKMLQNCKPLRYSIQGYVEETEVPKEIKDMLISAGYTTALIDAMRLYTAALSVEREIQRVNTKYRDEILRILARRGTMLHGDLATAIHVSASGLNAIVKQMNATSVKLINIEDVSKFKLYSITPVAYKYIMDRGPDTIFREKRPKRRKQQAELGMVDSKFKDMKMVMESDIDYNSTMEWTEIKDIERITVKTKKYNDKVADCGKVLKYHKRLA